MNGARKVQLSADCEAHRFVRLHALRDAQRDCAGDSGVSALLEFVLSRILDLPRDAAGALSCVAPADGIEDSEPSSVVHSPAKGVT